MLKRTVFTLSFFAVSLSALAAPIEKHHLEFATLPVSNGLLPGQGQFGHSVQQQWLAQLEQQLNHRQSVKLANQDLVFSPLTKQRALTSNGAQFFKLNVRASRFISGQLAIKGLSNFQVLLDGQSVTANNQQLSLTLTPGDHRLLLLAEQVPNWQQVEFDWQGSADHDQLQFWQDGQRQLTAEQLYDSETINQLAISADGRYLLLGKRHYQHSDQAQNQLQVLERKTNRVLQQWLGSLPDEVLFSPDSKQLLVVEGSSVSIINLANGYRRQVANSIAGAGNYHWTANDSVLYTVTEARQNTNKIAKHLQGLEDRWSYGRNFSQVFRLDLTSGFSQQLYSDLNSMTFEAFDDAKQTLLFSVAIADYSAPPHSLTELKSVDLASNTVTSLGQFRTFNQALFHDGDIYVVAGPEFADGLGKTTSAQQLSNNYDGQLYRRHQGQWQALSKGFAPAISQITEHQPGSLLLQVTEGDGQQLYQYRSERGQFQKLALPLEVVNLFTASTGSKAEVFASGSSATTPDQLYSVSLSNNKASLVSDSQRDYQGSVIGSLQDFDFTNSRGQVIDGRVYLPADFDPNRRYPALVYYYGGTSPVSRAFTGRYPFNLWTAHGYLVYVLQPAGSYGYGQEFSALHVNAWGDYSAADIIEGTEKFLAAYPQVDRQRVGNLGASYGGFMTMLLATKTKLFSASIAHAGISNLTSYWGQGWWGYAYSGEASKGSFPWNNPALYSEHSPVFHADKITTPLLMLHGDSDTNVPTGESHTLYTALKILGRDVELVEFIGDDHTINAREHRLYWWQTILAYFDDKLKGEPQWWQSLYPATK